MIHIYYNIQGKDISKIYKQQKLKLSNQKEARLLIKLKLVTFPFHFYIQLKDKVFEAKKFLIVQ